MSLYDFSVTQNNGEEIMFINTKKNPDSLVFENPSHDYPKKIVYHRLSNVSTKVYIYGNDNDPDEINLRKIE